MCECVHVWVCLHQVVNLAISTPLWVGFVGQSNSQNAGQDARRLISLLEISIGRRLGLQHKQKEKLKQELDVDVDLDLNLVSKQANGQQADTQRSNKRRWSCRCCCCNSNSNFYCCCCCCCCFMNKTFWPGWTWPTVAAALASQLNRTANSGCNCQQQLLQMFYKLFSASLWLLLLLLQLWAIVVGVGAAVPGNNSV